jgi:phage gpG-like protein
VRKTAADVESEVKKEMAAPKSGRRYRRGGGMHQASAPGEAPAVDLGQLINSIQIRDESDLTSVVGTNVEYATALEYGTRKMAPRPVWRPVAERLRKPFVDAITQILQRLK